MIKKGLSVLGFVHHHELAMSCWNTGTKVDSCREWKVSKKSLEVKMLLLSLEVMHLHTQIGWLWLVTGEVLR